MTKPFLARLTLLHLVVLAATAIPVSQAAASYALEPWNMDTRVDLPIGLKVWLLGVLLPTFLASVFFVKKHMAARWVLGGFFCSHLWLTIVEVTGAFTVQGGLVSLGHIVFWSPAFYALYRHRAEINLPSAYGIWACMMSLVFAVSMIFDIRDAAIWISAQIT
ncbi:MAG: hypothetical protein AAFY01_07185 [Pseudomonadota bacterium]